MSEYKKLITSWEPLELTPSEINETISKGGKILLRGILQRADTLNQNGRVYPYSVLEREVRNYQKFINENRACGECDHPESSVVNLKNVSHIIREATFNNGIVHGVVEILNTPSGKILQELLAGGVKLGISSRGVGTTKKEGDKQVVQDDFQLICWDIVSEPSTPGAFLQEGKRVDLVEMRNTFTKSDRIYRTAGFVIDALNAHKGVAA
jgi:hypothetical protein